MTDTPSTITDLGITGLHINYYVLCPRKLWWYTHGLEQEHATGDAGQENVALGALLHTESYPQQERKDILIDNLIRLDFTDDGIVHEVKKSKGGEKASRFQLLYYLYYLKHVKGINTTGIIDYPLLKRREEVKLTPALEAEVEVIMDGVVEVRDLDTPPMVNAPMPLCAKCAYQELCWG